MMSFASRFERSQHEADASTQKMIERMRAIKTGASLTKTALGTETRKDEDKKLFNAINDKFGFNFTKL